MAMHINPNSAGISLDKILQQTAQKNNESNSLSKGFEKYLKNVDNQQHEANEKITDLLSGKTKDINSVVSTVAKSDMSFKLLVGVRNKLVSAYQETMKMQI
jgi:flagellar hook-basal body complex protein FliE